MVVPKGKGRGFCEVYAGAVVLAPLLFGLAIGVGVGIGIVLGLEAV